MARLNICPNCGERMTYQQRVNGGGDTLGRWVCTITEDYQDDWDIVSLAAGTTDVPVADLLTDTRPIRESTLARTSDTLDRRLTELLNRVGPVPAGGSMVEELRRIYSAVDTLELSSDSIALNADAINLNTDTLENLANSTNTRLGDPGDPDTADTAIGRLKRLVTVLGLNEAARDADAATAQARLDLLSTDANLDATRTAIVDKNEQIRALINLLPNKTDLANTRQLSESVGALRSRQGRSYMSSTGRLSLTLAGNVRTTLRNPTGSGRNLFVYRVVGATSAGPAWAEMIANPTTGLPTTTKVVTNALIGGAAAVAVLSADISTSTALGGGATTGLVYAMFTGRTAVDLPAPVIIPPGQTMGFNVPFAGAADSSLTCYWWEEDVA